MATQQAITIENSTIHRLARARVEDFNDAPDGIASAQATALAKGLNNLRFAALDLATLAESQRYQLITAASSMDQENHDETLAVFGGSKISTGIRGLQLRTG